MTRGKANRMRLLLTNDDGIDAPGLEALARAARDLGQVRVFAPNTEHSSGSHRVTTHAPIRVEQLDQDRWAIHGTPADCVRLAVHGLAGETDWVLAGINAGGNLGADVHISGTVAAVREAVLHGWKGIAFSHYRRRDRNFDWDRASRWAQRVLTLLLNHPWTPGSFWNVNLPHLDPEEADPEIVFCPLDPLPLPVSYRQEADGFYYNANYHNRARRPGSDVDVCFSGKIAITPIVLPA